MRPLEDEPVIQDLEASAESGNVSPTRTINEGVRDEKESTVVRERAEDVESLCRRDDQVSPSRP